MVSFCFKSQAEILPLNDGHVHYDEDVWASLSEKQAIEWIKAQNIQRALVSATPAEGAEKLYQAAPDIIVPMLRPYKSWRHRYFWFKDPDLKTFLLEQLARVPYRGFGEFHVFGQDMDREPVAEMIEIARQKKLALHPHTDLVAIQILLKKAKDLTVIWAHGGFNVPVETLKQILINYPNLYIELSLREAMLEDGETLTAEWKAFLIEYQQRFLIGSDTYKPSRWAELPEILDDERAWLKQLPLPVMDNIARQNINRLFPE